MKDPKIQIPCQARDFLFICYNIGHQPFEILEAKIETFCLVSLAILLTFIAIIFYFRAQSGPRSYFDEAVIASITKGQQGHFDTLQLDFKEKGTYQVVFINILSLDGLFTNQVITVREVPHTHKLYLGTFFGPIKVAITRNRVTEAKNIF